MNCNQAQQNLEPALDGALDTAAQTLLHEHVSACAVCKEKLAQLEGVRALLREAAPTMPSESLDARVMGSFRRHHATRPGTRPSASRWRDLLLGSLRVPVPIMAMLLIAVMAIVWVAYRTGKGNAQYIVGNPPRSEQLPASDAPVQVHSTHPVYTVPAPVIARIVQPSSNSYRRNRSSAPAKNERREHPIKSSTVVTSKSTSYSTLAVLKGFEPLPIATARIIKGEPR